MKLSFAIISTTLLFVSSELPTPTYKQLEILLSESDLSAAKSRYQGYDENKDGVISAKEITNKFEYLPEPQIDLYWKSCDLNVDHKLNFKEWLPCSGIYSDNGHLFEQTEWDNMINDGYLRFDSFNKLELTDKALQEYSQRQPKIQRGADSGEIEL
jgi:hypothetical protein